MVITQNGANGLTAVRLVVEVHRQEQGHVPTPLQSMVDITAVNWDHPVKHKNVTLIPVVSFHPF